MRKDQCKFCTSRRCSERIVTPDMSFDEVACDRHRRQLALRADEVLNGAIRWNISSTGTMKRGEPFNDAEQGLHPTSGILPDLQAWLGWFILTVVGYGLYLFGNAET